MPTTPPITLPPSLGGGGPTPTPTTATTPTTSAASTRALMDPTTRLAILKQIQRSGWNAADPQPDIKYVSNGLGGVVPQVNGYKMVITDPDTGTNETVDLTYDPTQAGKGSQWGISGAPKDVPKPKDPSVGKLGSDELGWWIPDPTSPNGYRQVLPPHTPNADDEILKAVKRQDAEFERNEKAANAAAGRGYQTTSDYQKMALDAQKFGLSQQEFAEKIRQFDATQGESKRQFDIKQAAADKKDAADILQTGAQTGLTTAQTGQVQQATQIAAQKAPAEIDELKARTAQALAAAGASEATTKKALQEIDQANQPTTVQATLGTTTPNYAQVDPRTGQVSFQQNPNFQPKTRAEIAARVGQIQDLMRRKQAEVQAKVGQNGYTADDALKEFNTWHDQNVAPQQAQLQAAQEEAQFQRGKDQAAMRQGAYTAANAAGTQNISAFNAMVAANPVGAGYADVMDQVRQGKMPTGAQMQSAFTYQGPNPMDTAKQATMEALKYIDPTAAAATGAPPPNAQGMDIGAMLGAQNYAAPGVAPPPTAPAPAPAPVLPPPEPAVPPPGSPGLLPPGAAGVGGVDPRFQGALNPYQGGPPPGQTPPWMPQASGMWNINPYTYGG